jgi:hypothetical protein
MGAAGSVDLALKFAFDRQFPTKMAAANSGVVAVLFLRDILQRVSPSLP